MTLSINDVNFLNSMKSIAASRNILLEITLPKKRKIEDEHREFHDKWTERHLLYSKWRESVVFDLQQDNCSF